MQVIIKPARMWLLGADILLITILTTNFLQQKYHFNISFGIALGPILGIVLTMLMKINKVGKIFQIGMSYCWTSIILKFFGLFSPSTMMSHILFSISDCIILEIGRAP